MIESLKSLEKKQFLELANYLREWLKAHPHVEEDDDPHRQMRMYAMTYLKLYEEFLKLYKPKSYNLEPQKDFDLSDFI